ncbi:DUF4157 domain-containing protein [Microlunatus sp. Gsoil 973]|uniref:eCIS core domain-containing protein n=1 Tax=Microlunatus sp. Gsoil 973 TaxID=2672569 RepID=UPI0012B4C3EE|nr:DUF4157 domain-containing protein [Microlunatus sp. Gsoil 973]QGN34968.1 DUF4157 domain-containing protein [Microlunatus sp. Gsoil 973]
MHQHHGPEGEESLRPKSSRIDNELGNHQATAAAAGRLDALDAEGILGLQRAVGNGAVSELLDDESRSPVHDVINSSGRPLDPGVRDDMETRLGADFGDVRIHDDTAAHASATAVNAHAYTVGSNIVFQRDQYDPSSEQGRTTLAHELTHVMQQRSGPVDGTAAPGGIKISDPSDRFEREASANAERAMSTPVQTSALSTSGPAVQRQEAEEEEPEESVQGLFVQREAVPEEDEEIPM